MRFPVAWAGPAHGASCRGFARRRRAWVEAGDRTAQGPRERNQKSWTRKPLAPTNKSLASATSRLQTGSDGAVSMEAIPATPPTILQPIARLEIAGHRPPLANLPEALETGGDD